MTSKLSLSNHCIIHRRLLHIRGAGQKALATSEARVCHTAPAEPGEIPAVKSRKIKFPPVVCPHRAGRAAPAGQPRELGNTRAARRGARRFIRLKMRPRSSGCGSRAGGYAVAPLKGRVLCFTSNTCALAVLLHAPAPPFPPANSRSIS